MIELVGADLGIPVVRWTGSAVVVPVMGLNLKIVCDSPLSKDEVGQLSLYAEPEAGSVHGGDVYLDKLFYHPKGTKLFEWAHYMYGLGLAREDVADILTETGFAADTLEQAEAACPESVVGGKPKLCVGIWHTRKADEVVVYSLGADRDPSALSHLYLTDAVVDLSLKKRRVFHWAHDRRGTAWIKPHMPKSAYCDEMELVDRTGFARSRVALAALGFGPEAVDMAFGAF